MGLPLRDISSLNWLTPLLSRQTTSPSRMAFWTGSLSSDFFRRSGASSICFSVNSLLIFFLAFNFAVQSIRSIWDNWAREHATLQQDSSKKNKDLFLQAEHVVMEIEKRNTPNFRMLLIQNGLAQL